MAVVGTAEVGEAAAGHDYVSLDRQTSVSSRGVGAAGEYGAFAAEVAGG